MAKSVRAVSFDARYLRMTSPDLFEMEYRMNEVGFCRLGALKYALELINEKADELGLEPAVPELIPHGTGTFLSAGGGAALVRFVVEKGDQIYTANLCGACESTVGALCGDNFAPAPFQ